METESPSQLIPSEIHRMWTSSTPAACGSAAAAIAQPSIRRRQSLFFKFQGVHEQLLAAYDLDVEPLARRALQREVLEPALGAAFAAEPGRRDLLHRQLGALDRGPLGDELECELERGGHDLPQMPDLELHPRHAAAGRVPVRDLHDCLGYRELVHQQILGSGSPTSWSITRFPPNAVSTSTIPGGSVFTSPISAASSQPGTARRASSAPAAASAATKATSFPSFATYIGSIPSSSAAPTTAGCTGTSPSRTIIATVEARASSLRTLATPPRVGSRRQWSASPAASSRASTSGQSGRVSDSIGAA